MTDKEKTKVVLITESVYRKGRTTFEAAPDIKAIVAPENEAELSALIRRENPVAVVIGGEMYAGPLYESLQKGALIARFGVGCDGVDFAKAKNHGLLVTNTPETLESTVAELTVFLAGEVMRKAGAYDAQMKKGIWAPGMGSDLSGKTWAIIGFGRIGKALSRILAFGFGVEVIASKRTAVPAESLRNEYGVAKTFTDFAEAVREADIISLHIPVTKSTRQFLNADRLRLLKPGAIIINTGRGALIDEPALYDALRSGKLAGAGLDVFEHEPYVPVDPAKDFRTLDNVVLTPHIGSATVECAQRMAERVVRNIRFNIDGKHDQMDIKVE